MSENHNSIRFEVPIGSKRFEIIGYFFDELSET